VSTPNEHKKSTVATMQKPGSSFKDSLFVLYPAAVFYSPDSQQLLAIKQVTESAVFQSSMHEYEYQMRNAHAYLKEHWHDIRITDAKNVRYLVFRKTDGGVAIIDLDHHDPCGMFVFDRVQNPLLIDMTNVDTQVADYFTSGHHIKHE